MKERYGVKIRYNNQFLYKIFIFILVLMYMIESTSWTGFNDSVFHDVLQLSALAVAFIDIINRKYSIKELIMLFILNSIGLICFASSGLTGLFMTMLAITLLPKGALDGVLNMILKEEVILFIVIVLLSYIGILNNRVFDINKGSYVANALSLGFGHPNMLAAQGTSIVFLYLCVNRDKLKWKHYFLSFLSVLILFVCSRGRTSLLLGMIAIILIAISKNEFIRKAILGILPWMYIIVIICLIGCMVAYAKLGQNAAVVKFLNDSLFNGRIGLAYRSLLVYPITSFGKVIDTSIWNEYQYYSLDNGQVMVLLEYGICGFLAYFFVIQQTLKKLKVEHEVVLGIVMISLLIWSMYEGTMYFIGKNFALLFLGMNSHMLQFNFIRRKQHDS